MPVASSIDCWRRAARPAPAICICRPLPEGLEAKLRIDGVLHDLALVPQALAANVIARLKVQAELLTYRTDTPQEGRLRLGDGDVEMRLSTFPTLHGERAVVRLFGRAGQYEQLVDLGLPDDVLPALAGATAARRPGPFSFPGPAGSGKTTTVYACLRELAAQAAGARSLVSLEDPIEVAVPGVAQSQVNPAAGLDLATGLRFLMRQDPEVIVVGEIRDRATAEAAMQASLTGHLAAQHVSRRQRRWKLSAGSWTWASSPMSCGAGCWRSSTSDYYGDYARVPRRSTIRQITWACRLQQGLAAHRLPGVRRDRLPRADSAGGNARR